MESTLCQKKIKLKGHQGVDGLKRELDDSLAVNHAQRRHVSGMKPGLCQQPYQSVDLFMLDDYQHVGVARVPRIVPRRERQPANHRLRCPE